VSFAAIALYVASQRVFIVVVYFIIDSVRKLLDTPSYMDGWPMAEPQKRGVIAHDYPCDVRYSHK
jgi:uncharacterized protein HemY